MILEQYRNSQISECLNIMEENKLHYKFNEKGESFKVLKIIFTINEHSV